MNHMLRFLKTALRFAAYGLAFVIVAALLLVLFIGFTNPGAKLAANLIERFASTPDQIVQITDPSGLLTGELKVGVLTLNDGKGIYAEVRDLSVSWSPLQLLNFRFDAERLAAGSIRLERTPAPSQETEEVRSTFALPVDVKIDTFNLQEIIIGKAITGEDQFLSMNGTVDATNESIALTLAAAQRDRPDASAVADIVFNPPGNELKLEATIEEPRGGLLAKLLKLPGEPPVSVSITGEGPLSDWAGTATAALDGQERLKLDGRHQRSNEGLSTVSLTGGGTFDDLLPPNFRPLFQGTTEIDLVAAFDGTMLRIDRGSVETGALSLKASGTASQRGENDLTATLTGRDGPVDFRWPLAKGQIRALIGNATVSLTGVADAAVVDVKASLPMLETPAGQIGQIGLDAQSDGFNLASAQGPLTVTLTTGATRFASPDLDRLIKGPVKIEGILAIAPDTITFNPVTIESASIGGTLTGSFNSASQAADVGFKLFALPAVLPEALQEKFETTIALSGRANASLSDGTVDVKDLELVSDALATSGSASLDESGLTAALEGRLPNLGRLLADAKGEAAFTVDAKGPLTGLTVNAEVTSSGATLAGRTLSDLALKVEALADPQSPKAELTASGAIDGQAINVTANLLTEGGTITVPEIRADIGQNTVNGAVTLTADFKPEGNIDFNLPDIGLLAALGGQKASGDLAGKADIRTVNGVTSIVLTAKGNSLAYDTATIMKPAVDLTVSDLAALAVRGTVTAERVASGANAASNLNLAFTQQAGQTGFDLTGTYDGGPLVAKGSVSSGDGKTNIHIAEFSATPKRIPLRLASPSTIVIEDGAANLDGLAIQTGNGRVTVNGRAGQALDLSVDINALPATLVNAFAPTLGAEGAISGTVTVKGTAAAPSVGYKLNWANAAVAAARSAGVGAVTIAADGTFVDNRVTLETTLSGADGLTFRGGGTVGISGNTPLSLKFSGNLPFGLLAGQLASQGFTLTGTAAVDLSISGAAASPVITGTVSTSGARFLDARRNLAINDLAAQVSLDGKQATIRSLGGTLSSGGRIEAGGTVGITPGSGFPADLTVRLLDATYVDGTLFNAQTGGTLTLKGPLTGSPVLGGQLRIEKASITIPAKLPNSLSEINIQHRNAPSRVREMARDVQKDTGGDGAASSGRSGIGLDLTVTAPGQIFVRGRGIDAELGGDLTIRGTTASPVISGGFTLRRGRLEILGKRLDFTSGEIGFGGSLIPTVDLTATSTAGSTAITVNVAGSANNPTVTFASSPALPQDEVLAQLIFNRSMSNLSALQIAQLASAVSQLAGGSSTSLLDGLRGQLGIDDLDVTTDENGAAQVRAGKYLNDRTYIELQQGSDAGSGKAIINLDVGRGVKLRGEAGSDGSGAAGIFYEKEY